MLKLNLDALSPAMAEAVRDILPLLDMEETEHGIPLVAEEAAEGPEVYCSNDGSLVVSYHRLCEFFRGLSHLKKLVRDGKPVKEKAHFQWLSYMIDLARNAAMTVDGLKNLIRYLALNGFNDLMLYLEDMFEFPQYPYFGYMRGRYTLEELRELVAYGESFGVTLTPCVQSLGHFEKVLAWPCFSAIRDSDSVLYVGKEETYEFLDQMFALLCSVFKTRRFNIGMDEAHSLGRGRLLEEKGLCSVHQLMQEHLQRVGDLCRKHGISPLIWSDMFFRPYTSNGEYYSPTVHPPQEALDALPQGFTPVYWDYHSCEWNESTVKTFHHMLDEHLRFPAPVAYAGAAWRFSGYAPHNQFSLSAENFHLNACLDRSIGDITLTAWGNGGGEASHYVTLPIITLYGQKLYTAQREAPDLSERFLDLTGVELCDFLSLDRPDRVPDAPPLLNSSGRHPVTYLLYNDCLGGKMDRLVSPEYQEFYASLAEDYQALTELPRFGYLFRTQAALCRVLKNKATISCRLRTAYANEDKKELLSLCNCLETLAKDMDEFISVTRDQWLKENKVTGYEALEMRFGAIRQRALGAKATVLAYLEGKIRRIEPLEEAMLYHDCRPEDSPRSKVCATMGHRDAYPPSALF